MAQTIVEKIAQAHLADGPKRRLRAGDFVSIRPFHVMTHDNTSAVMSKFKSIGAKGMFDPKQLVFALDHDIQNRDEANLKKYRSIEAFAKEHGIDFYPAGSGIGHQLMVERGYVRARQHSSSLRTRTPICTELWAPLALQSSALTPPQFGPRENSGGRFRARFRWCWKANCPKASAARTSSSLSAGSTTTTRL